MKSKFIDNEFCYTGSELRSLYAYQNYELLGDSIVSWIGPCDVAKENMVDGEDLLANNEIAGDRMLHFIVERFDTTLFSAVALQRLMGSICIANLQKNSPKKDIANFLERKGDDIYFENRKLNISIATRSPVSALIHFAINISNEGTPVSTLSLGDLEIEPLKFAQEIMDSFTQEVESMTRATQKVKAVQ